MRSLFNRHKSTGGWSSIREQDRVYDQWYQKVLFTQSDKNVKEMWWPTIWELCTSSQSLSVMIRTSMRLSRRSTKLISVAHYAASAATLTVPPVEFGCADCAHTRRLHDTLHPGVCHTILEDFTWIHVRNLSWELCNFNWHGKVLVILGRQFEKLRHND
jgi:hypothetical protein